LRGLLHARDIELVFYPPDIAFAECRSPSGNLIEITPADRIMPRMEVRRGFFDLQNVDICRKLVVQFHPDDLGGKHRLDVEVRDLLKRMNPGIGSARPIDFDRRSIEHLARNIEKLALHRACIFLNLPAAVTGALVFYVELEP